MTTEVRLMPELDGVRVVLDTETGVCTVWLARPRKKNAFSTKMYDAVADALRAVDKDERVRVAVLTGEGDYFSSGNDLADAASGPVQDPQERAASAAKLLDRFTSAFVEFGVPLIALVNGPAIGIGCTILGLCDVVYCSTSATFLCPFAKLGQSPEGVSSETFPAMMGNSNANEMLMFGRRVDAAGALRRNLVSEVFPAETFRADTARLVAAAAAQPPRTMRRIKALLRDSKRDRLEKAMKTEIALLYELWQGEECFNAILQFMMQAQAKRKKRKKPRSSL